MRLILSFLIAAGFGVPVLSAQSVSSVTVLASDLAGAPASGARVTLISVGPKLRLASEGATTSFERVPFGVYDLEVRLPGFEIRRERIRVYQRELAFRVGLELASTHFYRRPELSGSIKTLPGRKETTGSWVRLVSLYSGDFVENAVDSAGRFDLAGMAVGKYILLLFQREEILATLPVEIVEGKQSLEIPIGQISGVCQPTRAY